MFGVSGREERLEIHPVAIFVGHGFHIADVNVAKCYEYGLGTEKDLSKALEWYEKAYANGVKEARGFADELKRQL